MPVSHTFRMAVPLQAGFTPEIQDVRFSSSTHKGKDFTVDAVKVHSKHFKQVGCFGYRISKKKKKSIDNEILMFKNATQEHSCSSSISLLFKGTHKWTAWHHNYFLNSDPSNGSIWQKTHNTFQQPRPLKCYIPGKCSYKVLFPLGPNLWPRFRLREICREQGLLAFGCTRNTQSSDVRLYLFLFHLSIGTCPLLPQISLAWSHYTTVYPFFKEGRKKR